jgi:glycosyltransferase involved in cell wall biosynthesis
MKTIWFVYPYGPIIGEKGLEFRYTRFAKVLAEKGYNVIWWTSNFSHSLKKERSKSWSTISVIPNFSIILVPTSSYKRNISIRRVLFELKYARNLGKRFRRENKPDLIMTSGTGLLSSFRPVWPYMKKNNIPVIYDIMDIHMINSYMSLNHKLIAPIVRSITKYVEKREKKFYTSVSAVSGLGRNQLDIAIERTGNRNIPSCLIYNGIYVDKFRTDLNKPLIDSVKVKEKEWLYCIYAGALGPSYDIESVIRAADFARDNNDLIKFYIAGSGPQAEFVIDAAKQNDRIVYLGVLSPGELIPIYGQCDIGLCTYASYSTVDMPDKFYDYCAAGLAIINSLNGEIKKHLLDNAVGFQYTAGNATDLYNQIVKFTDRQLLSTYRTNSYSIGNQFDIKNLMRQMIQLMDNLMS